MTTTWVTELVRDLRSMGFQVAHEGDGYRIYHRGVLCRTPDGIPLVIHTSPGTSPRVRQSTITRLIQARVLEEDPRVTARKRELERDPEVKAAKERARALRAEQRRAEQEGRMRVTVKEREQQLAEQDGLRERVRTLAAQIGSQQELGALLLAERPDIWRNKEAASVALSEFLRRTRPFRGERLQHLEQAVETLLAEPASNGGKPAEEEREAEPVTTTTAGKRIPFREFVDYRDVPGRRIEDGAVTETDRSWVCSCGLVVMKDQRDRRGRLTGRKNIKAHVAQRHVHVVCAHCDKEFPVGSLGGHLRMVSDDNPSKKRGPEAKERSSVVPATQTVPPAPATEGTPLRANGANLPPLTEGDVVALLGAGILTAADLRGAQIPVSDLLRLVEQGAVTKEDARRILGLAA